MLKVVFAACNVLLCAICGDDKITSESLCRWRRRWLKHFYCVTCNLSWCRGVHCTSLNRTNLTFFQTRRMDRIWENHPKLPLTAKHSFSSFSILLMPEKARLAAYKFTTLTKELFKVLRCYTHFSEVLTC